MKGRHGGILVTISDEDGNSFELEHIDTAEIGDNVYMAFLPTHLDEDDENYGIVIMKSAEIDGEEMLVVVDDEKEEDDVYNEFTERLYGDYTDNHDLFDEELDDFDDFDGPDAAAGESGRAGGVPDA
ncbi:MAG: DUF1292 domain-containing protein [Oscillospiraceae bacterium]|jgi:hypothetical protein|nr:DUF1292 domain-containing protein [Oscillospiraceae bacterium]